MRTCLQKNPKHREFLIKSMFTKIVLNILNKNILKGYEVRMDPKKCIKRRVYFLAPII